MPHVHEAGSSQHIPIAYLSSLFESQTIVHYARKAIDRIQQSFQAGRTLGLTSSTLDHAERLFRAMYSNTSGLHDRLRLMKDVPLPLTVREISVTVLTNNLLEFRRIARKVPSLKVAAP